MDGQKTHQIKEVCEMLMRLAIVNLQRDGYLVPVAFVFHDNGGTDIVKIDLDKAPMIKWARAIREYAGTVGAVGFATMADAWWVQREGECDLRPSEEPDRQEAIFLSLFLGKERMMLRTVHRREEYEEPIWESDFRTPWFDDIPAH